MTREEAIQFIGQSVKNDIDMAKVADAIKALEQKSIIDKIKSEIDGIEINGYIRDVECFNEGINVALNVINKYKEEMESK